MTSKERMLTATRNKQSHRVPVAPDTSNMIPCRLTEKPLGEISSFSQGINAKGTRPTKISLPSLTR